MQGKKTYQEKLFANFQLSERVPKDNFYRQLGSVLDLEYLYGLTRAYYGTSGQKSVDSSKNNTTHSFFSMASRTWA